ncbi:uncharacterized protein [Panulirus ornatus]|uniref:uncharacterized protein n=1 Tax=Panulirus ornatus TaxID=150431 RepID=UPI003A886F43
MYATDDFTRRLACKVVFDRDGTTSHLLEREEYCAKELRHPHLVTVLKVDRRLEGTLFLMELYEEGDLNQVLSDHQESFDLSHVRCVFQQLVLALQYVHGRSVAHRDIKLENILVKSRPRHPHYHVSLCDFGLCHLGFGPAKTVCGTFYTMAPEVFMQNKYDPYKADIWSLGVVLYRLTRPSLTLQDMEETMMKEKGQQWSRYPVGLRRIFSLILVEDPRHRADITSLWEESWARKVCTSS